MGGNAMSNTGTSRAVEAPIEDTTVVPDREEQVTEEAHHRDYGRPSGSTADPVVGVVETDSSRDRTPRLPNLAAAALERLASAVTPHDESADDFQPVRKKRRLKEAAEEECDEEEEGQNDGQSCSICFEPWSNSGGHRLASLKCGHLFGLNCIEKWLKGQGERCPQCNAKAKKVDIRIIFAKSISVIDTSEKDRALKELEEEKQCRIRAQKSEAQVLLQYQLAKTECERMKSELKKLREQLEEYNTKGHTSEGTDHAHTDTPPSCSQDSNTGDGGGSYKLVKSISVSTTGGARVMAYDSSSGMIVASKPSNNQLITGHGLVKVSLFDLRASEFVGVHSKVVRDVQFSPRGDGLTLTAGMDKTLKLTSMHSNAIVLSYDLPVAAWACCWSEDDNNSVYCGLANGTILNFDLRNTSHHVNQLKRAEGGSVPITSLSYVPLCRASTLNCSGLLAGSLDGSVFWQSTSDGAFEHHSLDSIPGSCSSISFEPITRHCLVSLRPSKRVNHARHVVCQLHNTPLGQPLTCQPLHQFNGGSTHRLLSRSHLFLWPNTNKSRLSVAFGDEASKSTQLWDVSTDAKLQQLQTSGEPTLDITAIQYSNNSLLTALTESKLHVFQWEPTTSRSTTQ